MPHSQITDGGLSFAAEVVMTTRSLGVSFAWAVVLMVGLSFSSDRSMRPRGAQLGQHRLDLTQDRGGDLGVGQGARGAGGLE